MHDEYEDYQIAIKSGDDTIDPLLRSELVERSQYRDKISQQLFKCLIQVSKSSRFSGVRELAPFMHIHIRKV